MSAELLDGKAVAAAIRAEVQRDVEAEQQRTGLSPKLVAILVGDDPASRVYVRNKIAACAEAGIRGRRPPAGAIEDRSAAVIVTTTDVDGILRLPLPKHADRSGCSCRSIRPRTLTACTLGRLLCPSSSLHARRRHEPAGRTGLPIAGSPRRHHRSQRDRRPPLGTLLMHRDATVTICHSKTRDLPGSRGRRTSDRRHRTSGVRARRAHRAGRDRHRRRHQPGD
jgi:methylenetetrahydrofolate dehydrogenase (NADP+)/methenyltetrahydrofolate cyclohydrolase